MGYLADDTSLTLGEETYGVKLVLHEALVNAVVHGNNEDHEKDVSVEVHISQGNVVTFTIQDGGSGFEWEKSLARPIDWHGGESGRGLFLFKKYGYSISYNQKGSKLTLQKKFV